jgi:hypothetical protein
MAESQVQKETVYELARALDGARVPYAFIGGVAVVGWGVPRATYDLDVAVTVSAQRMPEVARALDESGLLVDDVFRRGYRDQLAGMEKITIQLPVGRSLLDVDVFIESTPFLTSVIERRVRTDIGLGPIFLCTAADVLLFKLVAWRHKDRADIENVITVQGIPERPYLEAWAAKLGVRDRLDETLRELGLS